MGFAENYAVSLGASNLRDDAHHHRAEVLAADAFAARRFSGLLYRAKCGGDEKALAELAPLWVERVKLMGAARRWLKPRTEWDARSAERLYVVVAERSLWHWIDGRCKACGGAECLACNGTGKEAIIGAKLVVERVKDMISVLQQIEDAHAQRAARYMRG